MTVSTEPERATLLAEPHHDGSDRYVLERPAELGGTAVVRLRAPRGALEAVALRYVRDGEARVEDAVVDEETETETWWRAAFPVVNPAVRYRWLVAGPLGRAWITGGGPVSHGVPDADDFVLTVDSGGPDWHLRSVAYQVFPDRFARGDGGSEPHAPAWAIRREWDDLPAGRGPETPFEWFGGDLLGVEQRLDHVERLGASLLYLTPIFPAGSTHRYDATTFDRVDPLLGGDEALGSLLRAAHARGIRVVGDLTTNHCGDGHEWFRAAQADAGAPERELFYFDEEIPHGYESWLGIASLPKFDWRSPELRRRMRDVVASWLAFGLDGWRVDVANMSGRFRELDLNAEVAREVRQASAAARPDAVVVGEHFHDFRADLVPGGWHGVMNYSGFAKPVWSWLRGDHGRLDLPVELPELTGPEAVRTMRAFRAGVPWHATLHSWTLLDSHDTARFRTVAGSRERHVVGIGLQMTTPGVPCVFAGDEVGLEGEWGEDARRTMPWTRRDTWDAALHEDYRRLIGLRRSSEALARGGIRYAHVADDAIAYLRETDGERLLCLATRAAGPPVRLLLDALGCAELEPLYGGEAALAGALAVLPAEGPSFHVWRLIDG